MRLPPASPFFYQPAREIAMHAAEPNTRLDDSDDQVALATPCALPPALWGAPLTATTDLPEHLSVGLFGTVEGVLLICRCAACGGRDETLFDVRGGPTGSPTALDNALALVAAETAARARAWIPMHLECIEHPQHYPVLESTKRLLEAQYAAAAARLRTGLRVPGTLTLVMSDHSKMRAPLDSLPPSDPADNGQGRTAALHALHAALREQACRRGVQPMTAVLVAEAWCSGPESDERGRAFPASDPNRSEMVVVLGATRDLVLLGSAAIVREGTALGEGPARLEPLIMDICKDGSRLFDGLLAKRHSLRASGRSAE